MAVEAAIMTAKVSIVAVEAVEAAVEATVVASSKAEGLLGKLSHVLHISGVLSVAVRGQAVNARHAEAPGGVHGGGRAYQRYSHNRQLHHGEGRRKDLRQRGMRLEEL